MPVLVADHVSFAYGHNPVLADVTLEVSPGDFGALGRPNGSGKSTLIRVLLGLLSPAAGTVRLFDEDPRRLQQRWRLGYVPQRPVLAAELPATVEEVVAAGRLARRGWRSRLRAADRLAVDHALQEVAPDSLRPRRGSAGSR